MGDDKHPDLQATLAASLKDTSTRQNHHPPGNNDHDDTDWMMHVVQESLATHDADQVSRALHASLESEGNRVAQLLHRQEVECADQEMAQAVHGSEQQAQVEHLNRIFDQETDAQRDEIWQGSWDCAICTFTNRPYARHFASCTVAAPDHVLTFVPFPPTTKFGVEMELLIPQGRLDGFDLHTLAAQLTRLGPSCVKFAGYSHETTSFWKIVTDASIQGDLDDLSLELVSPILEGDSGIDEFRALLANIRRLGIAANQTCGFHVHVDATAGAPLSKLCVLRRTCQFFVALENGLDLLVQLRQGDSNQYCRSNRLAFGERSNQQRHQALRDATSVKSIVQLMNPAYSRYHKLNLTNLTRQERSSTIEFRQHGGVTDLLEAEAWVRLVVRLCEQCANSNCTTRRRLPLPETATPQSELMLLLELLDCAGLEQFYGTHRQIYLPPPPASSFWKCRHCGRGFRSSRSLAQHLAALNH